MAPLRNNFFCLNWANNKINYIKELDFRGFAAQSCYQLFTFYSHFAPVVRMVILGIVA